MDDSPLMIPALRCFFIDIGLKAYYTDSDGNAIETPRYYRKAEKRLKRQHRRLSRTKKGQPIERKPVETKQKRREAFTPPVAFFYG